MSLAQDGADQADEADNPDGVEDPTVGESGPAAPDPTADSVPEPEATAPDPFDEMRARLAGLHEQTRAYHARAEARERVIDQLHAEVERLRVGEQSVLLRPVVADLQHLRGDLLRQAETLPQDVTREQAARLLESFALTVELALERCGSEPVRPSVGEPFSPREHRAVGVIDAQRPDQDGTVGAVVAEGYRDTAADRVVVPAKVKVLRWNQPAATDIGTGVDTATTPESGTRQENVDD